MSDYDDIDRLSLLPDDIIHHILSFVSIECSVLTSTIAKRWRFHWAHASVFEFFDPRLTGRDTSNIMDRVMSINHNLNIDTFALYHGFDDPDDEEREYYDIYDHNLYHDYEDDEGSDLDFEFRSLIAKVVTRNVRKLVIHRGPQLTKVPRFIFSCETLVELELKECVNISTKVEYRLPALKKLELLDVWYQSRESLPRLLSGCPVLEELIVEGISSVGCCMFSPTITRLSLYAWSIRAMEHAGLNALHTPALRYLWLYVCQTHDCSLGEMNSLIEAYVRLANGWGKYMYPRLEYTRHVFAFVAKLYNVERLALLTSVMNVADSEFREMSSPVEFRNLTQLTLCCDFRFIALFLENANNLRLLNLDFDVERNKLNGCTQNHWTEPKEVGACISMMSHLEIVSIIEFEGYRFAFEIVRYLLKNAKVLTKMEILFTYFGELNNVIIKKPEAIKLLESFPRGSHACQLLILDDGSISASSDDKRRSWRNTTKYI